MLPIADINILEGFEDSTEDQYMASIQRAINSGSAWSLQGFYGRTMMAAIEAGDCLLGRNRASDFWGNTLPSRTDVREGTKGSYEFVANSRGVEWADYISNI